MKELQELVRGKIKTVNIVLVVRANKTVYVRQNGSKCLCTTKRFEILVLSKIDTWKKTKVKLVEMEHSR